MAVLRTVESRPSSGQVPRWLPPPPPGLSHTKSIDKERPARSGSGSGSGRAGLSPSEMRRSGWSGELLDSAEAVEPGRVAARACPASRDLAFRAPWDAGGVAIYHSVFPGARWKGPGLRLFCLLPWLRAHLSQTRSVHGAVCVLCFFFDHRSHATYVSRSWRCTHAGFPPPTVQPRPRSASSSRPRSPHSDTSL